MTPEELQQIENRRSKFDVPALVAEVRKLWAERHASKAAASSVSVDEVALAPSAHAETAVTKAGRATRTRGPKPGHVSGIVGTSE